jgi:hypothetical protein
MSLLPQNSDDIQCLVHVVQEFEAWEGIPVNTTKTKLMVVDGIVANRTVPVRVSYKDIPLDIPQIQTRWVIWVSGTLRMVTCSLSYNWSWIGPFEVKRPFRDTLWDLDRLDRYWRQGYKTVWKLNESVTDQPWTTPKNMDGMG